MKMDKLAVRLSVALITFALGLSLSALFPLDSPPQSRQVATNPSPAASANPYPYPKPPRPLVEEDSSQLWIVVEVMDGPGDVTLQPTPIKLPKNGGVTVVDLDLLESIDGQEVMLNFRDDYTEYRVLQRYRTSMSVSVEGPHLDLIDWRHFDSEWIPLKSLGDNRYRTLSYDETDHVKFPATTKAEIMTEVRRQVKNDWPELLELVKDCNGPNDGACHVGISSIYLSIQKKVHERWINIGLVDFQIPMGC